jgi:cytochrome oxidase Cu insertion factor (SCO1/SenC/PrrC family)
MKSAALVLWIGILATTAAGYGGWWAYRHMASDTMQFPDGAAGSSADATLKSPRAGQLLAGHKPHFTLTERSEKNFDTKSLEGKVWVVTFFFTSCPGPCLQQNRALAEVQKKLQGRDVRFVSITCDPALDTPARLREYADRFQADPERWLFLTGNLNDIKAIARTQFLLPLDQQIHSERAVVIDKGGEIRDVFATLDADDMQKMTRLLIEMDDAAVPDAS